MEALQNIKTRIKAVKNVGQITKAMEVVSATKMRKAQEVALRSRPYAFRALQLLQKIHKSAPVKIPLTDKRPVKTTLMVVIASDKGLAGSFNTQVFRASDIFLDKDVKESQEHQYKAVIVGKKANIYIGKKKINVVQTFTGFGDYAEPQEVQPLTDLIVNGFMKGTWDRVVTVATHFRSTLKQETLVRQVLPVDIEKIKKTVDEIIPEHGRFSELRETSVANGKPDAEIDYIFEPSPLEALNALIPHLVEMQMYHIILEANASEHSARMVAMKAASDNAGELSEGLTLVFNKARQAGITKEIIEITSTQNALQ